jgi:hypothetical protein
MKSGVLKEGLSNSSPKACDASTKLPTKTSVNSDATRTSVAKATNNIGPREA